MLHGLWADPRQSERPFGHDRLATSGIAVSDAQRVHVTGCQLDRFMNAIIVSTSGTLTTGDESYDVWLTYNRVTNCIGVSEQPRGAGIISFGTRVAMIGNFVHGDPASMGMTYLNEYTLGSITGTFQSGTGGTSTVTNGTWPARIADWTVGTSIMRTAQHKGWWAVGDTVTQAAGSASGTVTTVAPAPQIIKAGVRGSSTEIIDLKLVDGVVERATVNTGVILPLTTRLVAKRIRIDEVLDGRGFQLNTSSTDAILEAIRIGTTASVTVGEAQGICVNAGVGTKLRDCQVDNTADTSSGIHLEGCTNPNVDGLRVGRQHFGHQVSGLHRGHGRHAPGRCGRDLWA